MWGQQWNNLIELVKPYKDVPTYDVTPEMVNQGYDVDRMFRLESCNVKVNLDVHFMPCKYINF